MTDGACAPLDAQPIPQARCKVPVVTGGEKPKAILCASSEEACGHVNQTKKTVPSRIGRAKFIEEVWQFHPFLWHGKKDRAGLITRKLGARFHQ